MKFIRLVILAAIAAGVSSCDIDEKTFNEARPALRKRTDIQAEYLSDCTRRMKYADIELKRDIAGFMHTGLDGLPQKFCGRLLKGYLSGRMRYEDLHFVMIGRKFTPNMVAILRAG